MMPRDSACPRSFQERCGGFDVEILRDERGKWYLIQPIKTPPFGHLNSSGGDSAKL
jgi:hypothetical protein